MLYRIDTFLGEIPRLDPRKLPPGGAQIARNISLSEGTIKPLATLSVAGLAGAGDPPVDFIPFGGAYLPFENPVTYALGPVASTRLYFAEEGAVPKIRLIISNTVDELALPTPSVRPLLSIESAAPDPADGQDPLPVETVVMCYTWVSDLGEETPPSPISLQLDVTEGSTVEFVANMTPPAGSRITKARIYRSQTSATGTTALFFVKEVSVAVTTYVSNLDVDPLQEPLPSADYDPPVNDLEGITPLWNGMIAGFSGRSLYFCEPFIPHAWPIKYELKTDFEIMGLAATGQTLVVTTKGTPYIATGTAPENMILDRLDLNLPCISKRGVVDMGIGVAYPSHDGLILVQGGSPQNITRTLFDRRAWNDLHPETFIAAHYDQGVYVASYDTGSGIEVVMIDLKGETPGLVRTDIGTDLRAFRYDIQTGKLYAAASDSTAVYSWDDVDQTARSNLTWRSGRLHLPVENFFGCVFIEGRMLDESTAYEARIWRDDELVYETDSAGELNTIQRIAPGWGGEWEIEIAGCVEIDRISIAGTPDELMGG
jgi:hypothetical protein